MSAAPPWGVFISKTFDPASGLPDISSIEPDIVTTSIATSFDIVKNKTKIVCFMLKIVFYPVFLFTSPKTFCLLTPYHQQ